MRGRQGMARHRFLLWVFLLTPCGAAALWLFAHSVHLPLAASLDPGRLALAVLLAPVVEEVVFRGAVQPHLERYEAMRTRVFSQVDGANLVTSLIFAGCHLLNSPAVLATAVMVPSLALGRIRQLYGGVAPCIVLHAWFNACFALVFGPSWFPVAGL